MRGFKNMAIDDRQPPAVSSFIPAAFILAAIGWCGLLVLIYYATSTEGVPRWLFFFLSVLAVTGTALPVVAFLNRRFPSAPPPTHGVILRQAIWVGIYIPTLLWLRIPRVLTLGQALALAVGLVIIEWLLRLREKSQWEPKSEA